MQWSHVKILEFVCYFFYCLTSIFFVLFCFVFARQIFIVLPELSDLKRNVLFMEITIPMKSSILFSQNMQFLCKKEEEKSYFLAANKRSYFPKFSLVLSANMYELHFFTGKL